MMFLIGCSGKTPIQKYKATLDKKDIKAQVTAIDTLKDQLGQEVPEEDFIMNKQQLLTEIAAKNTTLIKAYSEIKVKDSTVLDLHTNLLRYTQNNEILITKTNELIGLYSAIIASKDEQVIEETYGEIVQLARSIDNLSQKTNDYRISWEEGLITLDAKGIQ